MTVDEYIEAQHQARLQLAECARYLRDRDSIIRRAAALGIPRTEIARILGMNRGHVSEIANKPGGPQRTSEVEGTAQIPEG